MTRRSSLTDSNTEPSSSEDIIPTDTTVAGTRRARSRAWRGPRRLGVRDAAEKQETAATCESKSDETARNNRRLTAPGRLADVHEGTRAWKDVPDTIYQPVETDRFIETYFSPLVTDSLKWAAWYLCTTCCVFVRIWRNCNNNSVCKNAEMDPFVYGFLTAVANYG